VVGNTKIQVCNIWQVSLLKRGNKRLTVEYRSGVLYPSTLYERWTAD